MDLCWKYCLTILITFFRYLSILMMLSFIVWIVLGQYIDPWYYMGLFSYPLLLMWGIVNVKYLHIAYKVKGLEYAKVLEEAKKAQSERI